MARSFLRLSFITVILLTSLFANADRVPLRNTREAAEAAYVSVVAAGDAAAAYRSLPATLRGDVWMLHLEAFLARNPELTAVQRSVIAEAIGLIATGAFEVVSSDAEQWQRLRESLKILEKRAYETLPPAMINEAFRQLSPHALPSAISTPRGGARLPVANTSWPDCNCATDSNYTCGGPTDPQPNCRAARCVPQSWGCGFMFIWPCDGTCSA